MRGLLLSLLAVAFWLPAATSEGQQPPTRREREAFRHLQSAEAAYEAEEYQDALRHLRVSWSLFEAPVIRFNQGKTLEALGRWHDAANAYEDFLTLNPEADSAAELEARIAELRRLCPHGPCEVEPADNLTTANETNGAGEEQDEGIAVVPLTLTVAGGVSLLGGVIAWGLAGGDERELSDEATPLAELSDLETRARRRANLGNVLVPVGAALVVAGVVWLFVRGKRNASVSAGLDGVLVQF